MTNPRKLVLQITVLSLVILGCILLATPSRAEPVRSPGVTSILDPSRMSVGLRAYRSFDEQATVAGAYSSAWWAGVPVAWELTSPHDPAVKFPVSAIAALDVGIARNGQKATLRGYVGLVFLLKRSGQ